MNALTKYRGHIPALVNLATYYFVAFDLYRHIYCKQNTNVSTGITTEWGCLQRKVCLEGFQQSARQAC